jgi:hypothetical protein
MLPKEKQKTTNISLRIPEKYRKNSASSGIARNPGGVSGYPHLR